MTPPDYDAWAIIPAWPLDRLKPSSTCSVALLDPQPGRICSMSLWNRVVHPPNGGTAGTEGDGDRSERANAPLRHAGSANNHSAYLQADACALHSHQRASTGIFSVTALSLHHRLVLPCGKIVRVTRTRFAHRYCSNRTSLLWCAKGRVRRQRCLPGGVLAHYPGPASRPRWTTRTEYPHSPPRFSYLLGVVDRRHRRPSTSEHRLPWWVLLVAGDMLSSTTARDTTCAIGCR